LGDRHFRRVIAEYVEHYHSERNHQGIRDSRTKLIIDALVMAATRRVRGRSRLGGLLNFEPHEQRGIRPGDTAFGSTTSIASRSDGSRKMRTKSVSKTITRDLNWLGPAIPPGEMLLEEFLKPMGIGQVEAARRLGISLNRLNEIVLGKRGITADTALRLGRLLKTSPQFWMRLQADWHLQQAVQRAARKAS
jgi:addiction module HigA family antidote